MQFEKTTVQKQPEDEFDPDGIEWMCPECGRTHPKNSPPCSRCGNMQLESVKANQFDEDETSGGLGLFDVAKFVGALAVVAVLVFAATNAGILGQTQTSIAEEPNPTVENVPGEANESSDLDLSTVEYRIYENINEARSDTLSLEPDTARIAEYYNKLMVKRGQYPLDTSTTKVFDKFGSCPNPNIAIYKLSYESETEHRAIDYYDNETHLAETLTDSWLQHSEYRGRLLDEDSTDLGVDVHVAENGDTYATVTFC
jgi:uncharacterized protein YkwD